MPNDQSHDTRTTDPLQRAVQAVNLNVAYRAADTPAGSVLFDLDWSNQPDWQTQYVNERYRFPDDQEYGGHLNKPSWVDFYYTSELWAPYNKYDGTGTPIPGKMPIAEVSDRFGSHDSPTGKSFITWDESYGTNSQWGADTDMLVEKPTKYKDAFIEFYVLFQDGYAWECVQNGGGISSMKVARARDYIGGETGARFGLSLDADASFLLYLQVWAKSSGVNAGRIAYLYKRTPNEGTEENDQAYVSANPDQEYTETLCDGNWHRVRARVKFNSAPGVADGKLQIAYDDFMAFDLDIELDTVGRENAGWNQFGWGGNADNIWQPEENQAEQAWAISRFRVYSGVPDDSKALFGE